MTDLVALVAAVRGGELETCGPLADWLDENDPPPAPGKKSRGQLLRRRWAMWKRQRHAAGLRPAPIPGTISAFLRALLNLIGSRKWKADRPLREAAADAGLVRYVLTRFGER